jgi:hypothetical protein
MPEAGFKPTITASEGAKTVNVLDHSATVTGNINIIKEYCLLSCGAMYSDIHLRFRA